MQGLELVHIVNSPSADGDRDEWMSDRNFINMH